MSDITIQIAKIRTRIRKSSGCSYLYKYFDELVESLNQRKKELSKNESSELTNLIEDFAQDSRYNNYASANWMRYSARCFYCADILVKYIPNDKERTAEEYLLNQYFLELVENGVAPIISQETFDKYLLRNIEIGSVKGLYNQIIRTAISECYKCRLRIGNEISLALAYTKAVDKLIRDYVEKYNDYSMLKEWFPSMRTKSIANFCYEYPDSTNFYHTRTHESNVVIETSDKILDVHLKLLSMWYWHNPLEVLDNLPIDDFIEVLEFSEDSEFEKILKNLISLPFDKRVEHVLKHFCSDDEIWVVKLSNDLLQQYETTKKDWIQN